MPCVKGPDLPIPSLTAGISIPKPSIPTPGLPELCCKLPVLPPFDFLPDLPPLDPVTIAVIREGIDAVLAYIDSIPLKCPRE